MSDYRHVGPNTVVTVVALPLLIAFFFLSSSLTGLQQTAGLTLELNFAIGLLLFFLATMVPFLSRRFVNKKQSRYITVILWRIGVPVVSIPVAIGLAYEFGIDAKFGFSDSFDFTPATNATA